jgi:hypothetical protein
MNLSDARQSGGPVSLGAHHLDIRFVAERVHHQVPDHHGIVHHQDPDLALGRARPA